VSSATAVGIVIKAVVAVRIFCVGLCICQVGAQQGRNESGDFRDALHEVTENQTLRSKHIPKQDKLTNKLKSNKQTKNQKTDKHKLTN
jgi:phage-related minor tail protein